MMGSVSSPDAFASGHSNPAVKGPDRVAVDTGSVWLQDGPDTIPLFHQSNGYFWPEDQLSP